MTQNILDEMNMRELFFVFLAGLGLITKEFAHASERLYENNFENAALGAVPDEFLVLNGDFSVKQENGNKFLEAPGAPVDTYGTMVGPTEKEGWAIAARIFATSKGRRFPTFAVGLNGGGGYKLQVSPAKKLVELYAGETVKASAPYEWESGKWTRLHLEIDKLKDGSWKVVGKAWTEDQAEPAAPLVALEEKEEPTAGKASVWGSPYSGTPIRFDDLAVSRTSVKP